MCQFFRSTFGRIELDAINILRSPTKHSLVELQIANKQIASCKSHIILYGMNMARSGQNHSKPAVPSKMSTNGQTPRTTSDNGAFPTV